MANKLAVAVVMAGPGSAYANHLNIGVALDSTGDGFSCEEIAAAITAAMVVLAPKLLQVDALEGVEIEAICGVVDNPASIIDNLKQTAKVSRRRPKAVGSA